MKPPAGLGGPHVWAWRALNTLGEATQVTSPELADQVTKAWRGPVHLPTHPMTWCQVVAQEQRRKEPMGRGFHRAEGNPGASVNLILPGAL